MCKHTRPLNPTPDRETQGGRKSRYAYFHESQVLLPGRCIHSYSTLEQLNLLTSIYKRFTDLIAQSNYKGFTQLPGIEKQGINITFVHKERHSFKKNCTWPIILLYRNERRLSTATFMLSISTVSTDVELYFDSVYS